MPFSSIQPCPGGPMHLPAVVSLGGYFWVECPDCMRQSYAVESEPAAKEAWATDVGLPGRSALIENLRAAEQARLKRQTDELQ